MATAHPLTLFNHSGLLTGQLASTVKHLLDIWFTLVICKCLKDKGCDFCGFNTQRMLMKESLSNSTND